MAFQRSHFGLVLGIVLGSGLFTSLAALAKEKFNDSDRDYIARIQALKAPHENRKFQTFILPNQLEVLLIQDPAAEESAVALDVNVGFLQDSPRYRGMAHYLEHMLFLGTEKYPEVDFDQFLSTHGGSSNANTWLEHTNYHMECNPSAFPEALDRFAQFFIHPLFNEKYVEKELKNVDSEFSKDLSDEQSRQFQLMSSLSSPEHPIFNFFQGNLETLKKYPRTALIEFFEKYYSANLMKLAMISPRPLSEIEGTVRDLFSQIPNRNTVLPTLGFNTEKKDSLPRLVEIKRVAEGHQLNLMFSLSPYAKTPFSTPQTLVADLLGKETDGSLSKVLQDSGWVLNLSASPTDESYQSKLIVSLDLTEKGYERWHDVITLFFSYIQMLKREELQHRYFEDFQRIQEIKHIFRTPDSGMEAVEDLAKEMHSFPAHSLEAFMDLQVRYSRRTFAKVLQAIVPDQMQILLSSSKVKTNQVEPFFKTEYKVTSLRSTPTDLILLEKWRSAIPDSRMHYPKPNEFLPSNLSFDGNSDPVPLEIRNDELSRLWFQEDHTFRKPYGTIKFRISVPMDHSIHENALFRLYSRAFEEQSKEMSDAAGDAGLRSSFQLKGGAYEMMFSGYSEKLELFAGERLRALLDVKISQEQFENLKKEMLDELKNDRFSDPIKLASRRGRAFTNPFLIPAENSVGDVKKITLSEVQDYSRRAFRYVYLEGFGFGHLKKESFRNLAEKFLDHHKSMPLPPGAHPLRQEGRLPTGKAWTHYFQADNSDNAWLLFHQFGKPKPERFASLFLGDVFLSQPFYTEMRTNQNLGYGVWAQPEITSLACGERFLIQSNQGLDRVQCLAESWIDQKIHEMASLTDEAFEEMRIGALESYTVVPKTFSDRFSLFEEAILDHGQDWQWKEKRLDALKNITKQEVIRQWTQAFNPEKQRRMTIQVEGTGAKYASLEAYLVWLKSKVVPQKYPKNFPKFKEVKIHDFFKFRKKLQKYSAGP